MGFVLRQVTHEANSNYVKVGGDYRTIGVQALNYGASTGTYNFTGGFSNNALADLLLGYPQNTSNVPLNTQLDGFVRYASAYAQDDWRVTSKLTINYGLRLEHESGLQEKNNQFAVGFDQTTASPLDAQVNLLDPVTGQRRQTLGGLIFAGVNGAPTEQGNQPLLKAAPRAGAVYSFNDKTVLRGGWGLYYSPWNFPAAGTNAWGQTGYSAQTNVPQVSSGVPTVSLSNPFPNGLVQPSGSSLGLLTGAGGDIYFVDPNRGAPRVQPFLFGGTPRPNLTGDPILAGGNITDRITANVADNLYFNRNAFTTSAANTFGSAPRTLPGVYSPWRNNVDLSISKLVPTGGGTAATIRLEVLNMFNIVQWAAPASSVFGNSAFGQINNQANNMRMLQFTARFQF